MLCMANGDVLPVSCMWLAISLADWQLLQTFVLGWQVFEI